MDTYLLADLWAGYMYLCVRGIWSTQVGEQWHARCLKRNGWVSIDRGGRDRRGKTKMIGAEVGGGVRVVMGKQPAEWGQQGGNWSLKALFMLGLFQQTLRTLQSSPCYLFFYLFLKTIESSKIKKLGFCSFFCLSPSVCLHQINSIFSS